MAKVIEFKGKEEYSKWLQKKGNKVRIISVNSEKPLLRKKWCWKSGFINRDEPTYIVTYEEK